MGREHRLSSSFRDPAGFVFRSDGKFYRRINRFGAVDYELLLSSGLYEELCGEHLLLSHEEIKSGPAFDSEVHRTILPRQLGFISYPYEWCFGQLQAAALLTLDIQRRALSRKMTLKDCSAFNIQWLDGRPVMIDTLSFEAYAEGAPWTAYRQFCQHFLVPLALMATVDLRLNGLWRNSLEGIPIDLGAKLLPRATLLKPGLLLHIHLHTKSLAKFGGRPGQLPGLKGRVGKNALLGMIDSLAAAVSALQLRPSESGWNDYYHNHSYSEAGFRAKKEIVRDLLAMAQPHRLWDLGANTGVFSQLALECGVEEVTAWDYDFNCVQYLYEMLRLSGETKILPLVLDLANPTPALGWQHRERLSLLERGPVEAVLALALVHHLAIGNNLPFPQIAEFFSELCGRWLIIEFVPKEDAMVQHLLATRRDIFPHYSRREFESCFLDNFFIRERRTMPDTGRHLYLMERKVAA